MAFFTNPNKRVTVTGADGLEIFGDYVADATTDLDDEIDGDAVAAGSLCLVISTGEFYCMGSDGSWHNVTTPEGEETTNATTSLQNGRTLLTAPDLKTVAPETEEEETKEEPEESPDTTEER